MSAIPSGGVGSTQIFWLLPGQFTLPTEFTSLEGEKTLVPLDGDPRDQQMVNWISQKGARRRGLELQGDSCL